MKTMKAIIVDDMPLSRSRMRRYLSNQPQVEIVGEFGDAESALDRIAGLKPDLVLLDIQLSGMSGLEMLDRIPEADRPAVIFVTAFEEFAVSAFGTDAVDYILKPFDLGRLEAALGKAERYLELRFLQNISPPSAGRYLERIAVKMVGRTILVDVSKIDWIETDGNYLVLHCGPQTHLVRETMKRLEQQLDPAQFVRVHRTAMVRIDTVKETRPLFNGDRLLILANNTELTMSRSYRNKVRASLGDV